MKNVKIILHPCLCNKRINIIMSLFKFQIILIIVQNIEPMDLFYLSIAGVIIAMSLLFILIKGKKTKQSTQKQEGNTTEKSQRKSSQPKISTEKNQTKVQEEPKKKQQKPLEESKIKKLEQIEKQYEGLYFGSFRLKAANSIHPITSIDFRGPKVLLSTTKNQMVLFNLKTWKRDVKHSTPQKYFVSLDNNGASAVCIGQQYYYAALNFDKTIVYFQFKGESGIYFKQVARFPRNILKSNASALHVSKQQKYIITAGSGADTVVDVWSMKGQKLATQNSFQIQHYTISSGMKDILIRGWTSQVKIFGTVEQKDGTFKKLQKKQPLAHQQSPLSSAIDNRDMYAVSVSKHHKVKVWNIFQQGYDKTVQSNQSHTDITKYQVNKCAVYTFESAVGRFKTLVVLCHDKGFIITDSHLRTIQKVQGIEVKDIYLNGTSKNVILGTVNNQGQLSLWNLTKELEKVQDINI